MMPPMLWIAPSLLLLAIADAGSLASAKQSLAELAVRHHTVELQIEAARSAGNLGAARTLAQTLVAIEAGEHARAHAVEEARAVEVQRIDRELDGLRREVALHPREVALQTRMAALDRSRAKLIAAHVPPPLAAIERCAPAAEDLGEERGDKRARLADLRDRMTAQLAAALHESERAEQQSDALERLRHAAERRLRRHSGDLNARADARMLATELRSMQDTRNRLDALIALLRKGLARAFAIAALLEKEERR